MHIKSKLINLTFILSLLIPATVVGQVRLPKLVSDGMVLQREADVKIWSWAAVGEKVTVNFLNKNYKSVADSAGVWAIRLKGMKAGGPYTMTMKASNTVTLQDILIGDVWLCSGQSNMELPMRRVKPLYEQEIANSENDLIRYFDVPQEYDFNKQREDVSNGQWQKTNPDNVLNFSAVAYFFGNELYNKYQVPIGLIDTSLGGSPAEAWMSEDALKAFPEHYQEAQKFKDANLPDQANRAAG
ncbi:sialate O-acetylesterase [Pontibacter silvestris]|uniref:Sialate O-acetylesterase n=1 Tax=Pontibacter silvestris TaxID=2305183 RepID=A0ABW4WVJ3_9BACT|nr:sialate O-acetylesterase [Pontibacter silvestris]MCC9136678.1 hypothetical protein [Pontibacter silvestris]